MTRLAYIAVIAIFLPYQATGSENQFAVQGVGNQSCEEFLTARQSGNVKYERFGSWIAGYLTAYNQLQSETVDIAPWQSIDLLAALMAQHCQKNLSGSMAKVATDMVNALYDKRLQQPSEQLQISISGNSVQIYREVLKRAQQNLTNNGLYSGDVDGKFGPETERALRRFQERSDLPTTGLPDEQTLYKLLD